MKKIKNLILIFTLMIISFLGIGSAKALAVTEDDIINYIVPAIESKYTDFNFKEYRNVVCADASSYIRCRFYSTNDLDSFNIVSSEIKLTKSTKYCEVKYYPNNHYTDPFFYNNSNSHPYSYYNPIYITSYFIDKFENEEKVLLDFSDYFGENEEPKEELEITIKATEVLDSMLDKTKNIYEVLINNQIFKLCLGVLLSYLIFIFLYKIFKD